MELKKILEVKPTEFNDWIFELQEEKVSSLALGFCHEQLDKWWEHLMK